MNARKRTVGRLSENQIDKLKILATGDSFQSAVLNFRKKFSVDLSKGTFNVADTNINPLDLMSEIQNELLIIGNKFNLPYPLVRSQLMHYIKYNKWSFDKSSKKLTSWSLETPPNYKITVNPPAQINKDRKVFKYSKTVSLVTFASLSSKEEKQALKELRSTQKAVLDPVLTKKTRHSNKIDRNLNIEKEMLTREPKHKEEKMSSEYTQIMKSQFEKGNIDLHLFNKIKKENPHGVEVIKKGKTSSEVASKMLGSRQKSSVVRKINSRMKKKRKETFGDL